MAKREKPNTADVTEQIIKGTRKKFRNDLRHERLTHRVRDQLKSIDGWRQYCERIKRSDFLMGRTERDEKYKNWRPDFDCAIKRSTCDKVLEGNFDNRRGNGGDDPITPYRQALLDWHRGGEQGPRPREEDFEPQHEGKAT